MFRVGVCWHGTVEHGNDADRSAPYSFMPFFTGLDGIEAVSLQYGEPLRFRDYLETAQFIQMLDCVVTVDTSVVHVAGTLGIPTFCLVPTVPDWRWPASWGEYCPWYKSVVVLRRDSSKNWRPTIEEAVRRVQLLASSRS